MTRMMQKTPTQDEVPEPFIVRIDEFSKEFPEARAHLMRIKAMLTEETIEHPRVQTVVQRQVFKVIADIAKKGMYIRDPRDDHELLQVQSEVTSRG